MVTPFSDFKGWQVEWMLVLVYKESHKIHHSVVGPDSEPPDVYIGVWMLNRKELGIKKCKYEWVSKKCWITCFAENRSNSVACWCIKGERFVLWYRSFGPEEKRSSRFQTPWNTWISFLLVFNWINWQCFTYLCTFMFLFCSLFFQSLKP